MKHLFIIFIIVALLFSSCLGRTARSGGGLLSTPELEAQWGPDLNGNGLPDALEDAVREANGLGPNEPVSDELVQQYLDSLAANNANQAGEWTPADITAMTGLGAQVLSSAMNSLFSYLGQSAMADAEAQKFKDLYGSGKGNFATAPAANGSNAQPGNVIQKDAEKIDGEYISSKGGKYTFRKPASGATTGAYTFSSGTTQITSAMAPAYTIMPKTSDNPNGGYIILFYSSNGAGATQMYTLNVSRCCLEKDQPKNAPTANGYTIDSNIDDYNIYQFQIIGSTGSANINDTYAMAGGADATNCAPKCSAD